MHTSCQNATPHLMMKMWKHSHQRLKKQGSPIFNIFPKLTTNRLSLLKEIGDINIRQKHHYLQMMLSAAWNIQDNKTLITMKESRELLSTIVTLLEMFI